MSDKEFHQKLNELKDIWLKAFNLENLEQDYIADIPKEVKDYIGNQVMKITQGNFIKLLLKNREKMISFIKPTIENPNLVLDDGRGILFIKEFVDKDKNTYFMSVSKMYNGEWVFTSHTKREFKNIQNKIKTSNIILNKGFERSEVAGTCDILESGGEVSKPSHLQIKYTANQDFGTNPNPTIPNPTLKNTESTAIQMRVKADDESVINYGERDYGKGHRLLTAHSRTERGERGQPHQQINDLDFHNSANEGIILQKSNQSQIFDMNDDSALKVIKNEVSNAKESQANEKENKEKEANKINIERKKK